MLSETDKKVLSFISKHGPCGVSSIGRECFRDPEKGKNSGALPAASHLARMVSRGILERAGTLYRIRGDSDQATLFD